MRYHLCHVDELPPGQQREYTINSIPLVLVRTLAGEFHVLYGLCPHQRGPLSRGLLTGATEADCPGDYRFARDGEILRCPWHGFEYDVLTGQCLSSPQRFRVKTYPVTVEDHTIFLELGS